MTKYSEIDIILKKGLRKMQGQTGYNKNRSTYITGAETEGLSSLMETVKKLQIEMDKLDKAIDSHRRI